MTLEAVCMFCDGIYAVPTVAADSRREAAERLVRVMRFPICLECHEKWDMQQCPDGQEHEWVFEGHASFKGDESVIKVGECRRCATTYLMPS